MTSDVKQIFRDNLMRYMEARGISQKELAEHIQVSTSTLNDWAKGKKLPRMDKVDKLCSYFGVTRTDFLDMPHKNRTQAVKIPVLGTVVAGLPMEAIENIVDYEEITPALAAQGEFFALRIKGQSMEPRICEGDVVIVRKQEDIESGDTAIVLVNGAEATVKKVKKTEEGIMLIANNMAVYSPHFYSNKDIESLPVQIIGKVVELRGKL